jgi:succinate dehydrogenase / fumarate reductase iron-sulfur subunit
MLDVANEGIIERGQSRLFDPTVAKVSAACALRVINGIARRHKNDLPEHMRHFKDGQTITIEPWRALFPRSKICGHNRADSTAQKRGVCFVVNTGSARTATRFLFHEIPTRDGRCAMHRLRCVRPLKCLGAFFVAAKVSHLNCCCKEEKRPSLLNMVKQMDAEGFGTVP